MIFVSTIIVNCYILVNENGLVGDQMQKRIAILADIHGNYSAMQAVVRDIYQEQIDECWVMGDLFMPGPGANNIWQLLHSLHPTVWLRGNWDDDLIHAYRGDHPYDDETKIMISRIGEYIGQQLGKSIIDKMAAWPISVQKRVGNLRIVLNHNLPNNNAGQGLFPTNDQPAMDQIMPPDHQFDIGIYAHVHHQLFRYTSNEQLILNPGSVGEPYDGWNIHQTNLRSRYLILTIDDHGLADLDYRRVSWDREQERQLAQQAALPYREMYLRHLEDGRNFIHDHPFLAKINRKHHYLADVQAYSQQ